MLTTRSAVSACALSMRMSSGATGDRWWRRPPFLPVPDPAYLAFRLETQYGAPDARPLPADVVAYLRWCRAQDRLLRRQARGRGQAPQ